MPTLAKCELCGGTLLPEDKGKCPCNVAKEEFRARKVDKDAAGLADETKGPLRLSAAAFHQYYVTEAERTSRGVPRRLPRGRK